MSFRNIAILFIFNIIYYINSQTTDGQKEENSQFTNTKRDVIPSIYVRGSHYEVGYSIGFTYRHIIQDFLNKYEPLIRYEVESGYGSGKKIYNNCLKVTNSYFPQYIKELEGIANGADVNFKKLFLIHMDELIKWTSQNIDDKNNFENSTVMINRSEGMFMGQNVNVSKETINHYYIVHAHIIPTTDDPSGIFTAREEKWTSLTYAGMLSGYMGGYNYHGLVYTINRAYPHDYNTIGIPQVFLTRALLASKATEDQIKEILLVGTADPFSVCFGTLYPNSTLYVADVFKFKKEDEDIEKSIYSSKNLLKIQEPYFYTNNSTISKFEEIQQKGTNYNNRNDIIKFFKALTFDTNTKPLNDVKRILGANIGRQYKIYKDNKIDNFNTMISGIFDFQNKTWTIWTKNPYVNPPSIVLSLDFKNFISPNKVLRENP